MERAFERRLERKLQGGGGSAEGTSSGRGHDPPAKVASSSSSQQQGAKARDDGIDHDVPMSAADAIPRILLYHKRKDYFRCLELPRPTCDEINRPVWSCTSSDISRGYRNVSKFVHPDKNPHPQARTAFEALNEVVRALRDPNELEVLMKEAADVARENRDRQAAAGDVHERIAQRAGYKEREKALKKEQGMGFDAQIRAQMKGRQDRIKKQKEMKERSRYRREDEDEGGDKQGGDVHNKDSQQEAEPLERASDSEEERPKKRNMNQRRKKVKMIF